MVLSIAGVVHDDVKGRLTLRAWLEKLAARKGVSPGFVGVEYDKRAFREIKEQRPILGELLRSKFSGKISDDLSHVLETSLGYEGDTHIEVFPKAETFWLDEGDYRDLTGFAATRFIRYRTLLSRLEDTADTHRALTQLSVWAWQDRCVQDDPSRDAKWVRLIRDRIEKRSVEWAIIVVGGAHVRDEPGTVVSLMRSYGYPCEAEFMGPTGASPHEPPQELVFGFE